MNKNYENDEIIKKVIQIAVSEYTDLHAYSTCEWQIKIFLCLSKVFNQKNQDYIQHFNQNIVNCWKIYICNSVLIHIYKTNK